MCQPGFSQADSIFFKREKPLGCHIQEISETKIHYRLNGSSVTYTASIKEIDHIMLANGKIEKYQYHEPAEPARKEAFIPKTEDLTQEQKERIEKLAYEAGKKIGACGLGTVQNLATFIDWGITQYDAFNKPNIIIYCKLYYDRFAISERQFANVKITLNEETNTIKWKVQYCTNKSDELALLQCQKRSL